ncbi:MAG: hypothetical protein IIA41_06395 [SAR324 cluster bacterium]|nr:hypothetical protein [SAR324 cluster bacterium]
MNAKRAVPLAVLLVGMLAIGGLFGCSPAMQVKRVSAAEAASCEELGSIRAVQLFPYGRTGPTPWKVRRDAQVMVWEMGGNALRTTHQDTRAAVGSWEIVYEGVALKCDFGDA